MCNRELRNNLVKIKGIKMSAPALLYLSDEEIAVINAALVLLSGAAKVRLSLIRATDEERSPAWAFCTDKYAADTDNEIICSCDMIIDKLFKALENRIQPKY